MRLQKGRSKAHNIPAPSEKKREETFPQLHNETRGPGKTEGVPREERHPSGVLDHTQ